MLRSRALAAAAVAAATIAPAALAWNGKGQPNDPNYAPAESDPLSKCINDEQWPWFSFMPKCTPLAKDPEGASGMSIDKAWSQFTAGRPDVRIAYIEGGPNWHIPVARQELAGRMYLNTGELPLPEHANGSRCSSYDCNHDGVVNVYDYAQDPRVHRPYLNGSITPQDLIKAFSNHRDDDHDGYVDDIAGWNFQHMTNDPTTPDATYPHSDEQMQKAAAEANNGVDRAGVCPNCTILPIKAGDEALDRSDRLAESIFFAADSGVSAMVLETADLGYSRLTQAAIHYAHRKGIVIVQSSNDFDSADHQGSMFWDDVWPGNAVVSDGTGTIPAAEHTDRLATTFRERSNYTSFGPKNLFSGSSPDGTTSGTDPMLAGIAALLKSYGLQIHSPLNAGEVKQVLRATVSPIDDPSLGWPGKPGATFNIQYGYGRPNVYRAMQAVRAGRVPPVPEISAPRWYSLLDPTRVRSVPISAELVARRARGFSYVVQYGLGPDPKESEFRTIAHGSVKKRSLRGRVATLKLSRIPRSFWRRPFGYTRDLSSTEQYDVTIRIRMTDDRGLMGEDRRAIQVYHDPSWQRGFPRDMGIGQESQPVMADLDGDGKLELIFGDSNGMVHAIRPDNGRELPGWPVHTLRVDRVLAHTPAARAHAVPRAYEPIITPAAVGDLNGDGRLDVVVTSTDGRVYAFGPSGRRVRGFPRAVGAAYLHQPVPTPAHPFTRPPSMGAAAAPVLAHLPGSRSKLDVLQAAWDSKVYAFDSRGRNVPGWPVTVRIPASARSGAGYDYVNDAKILSTPTLANVAGDRTPEIVVKSQQWDYQTSAGGSGGPGPGSRFYDQAIWADGNRHPGGPFVPGWPARMQGVLGYYGTAQDWITEGGDSPSAAGLAGGGRDELIQPTVLGLPQLIHPDASVEPLGPQPTLGPGTLSSLSALGQTLAGHPPSPTTLGATPTLDSAVTPVGFTTSGAFGQFGGKLQWLSAGSDLSSLSGLLQPGKATRITNFMRVYDPSTGTMATGFPAPMMGLAFLTAPAVADVSGDGHSDVVNAEDTGNVAAFDSNGNYVPGWPKFTGGWTVWTPAVGDANGDGRNEVAASTREGYLFLWRTPGRAASNEAYAWHQDLWHTGRYGTDTRPPAKPQRFHRAGKRKVCWVAPGDDWMVGRAKSYELRAGKRRLRHLPRPARAGTRQCVRVPRGARRLRLRARDHAGLVSPWATLRR
ncbi:MAG: VCBS repeat-containing protein [Actinobacteria bacterium]|nr:VCBS repeat-containing protein [Actinomycetota bacterium]